MMYLTLKEKGQKPRVKLGGSCNNLHEMRMSETRVVTGGVMKSGCIWIYF